MTYSDTFKTIESVSHGRYKDKGSNFLASAFPVSSESDARFFLDEIRRAHHDAKHHCYAYLIGREGNLWRANDDGEPSGTAGRPILGQIRSLGLTNVMIAVTRYFGGTLLGVSGLINAYKSAARDALSNARIIDHIILETYEITFPYSAINDVMKILKGEDAGQSDHRFDVECKMTINFRSSAHDRLFTRLQRIDSFGYRFISVG